MKKTLVLVAIMTFLVSATVVAQEVRTIKGEVIDISCYVTAGAKGAEHKDCAIACIQAGEPAGILEEGTGKAYVVITEDHATNPGNKVLPYVAKMVEATGTVSERAGISTIDIKDIKEIKGISEALPKQEMPMQMKGTDMKQENRNMGGY